MDFPDYIWQLWNRKAEVFVYHPGLKIPDSHPRDEIIRIDLCPPREEDPNVWPVVSVEIPRGAIAKFGRRMGASSEDLEEATIIALVVGYRIGDDETVTLINPDGSISEG